MNLLEKDSKYIWHPYTPVKGGNKIIPIVKGQGALLFDENGNEYIDAVSSWWTNIHGHSHPYINQKITEQLNKLEHVIFAGFTHEPAVTLAERLLSKVGYGQVKAFYTDNGSTAVEVALKMAFQYWSNKGEKRTKVLAFENAYHGDTFGAMSVSGRSIFTDAFSSLLFEVEFIPVPDGTGKALSAIKEKISQYTNSISSFIFEPMVQGTAGMVMYDVNEFNQLAKVVADAGVLLIADEVFTGFYRTGKPLAVFHTAISPDIICMSKGITGGYLPLGLTTCNQKVFSAFETNDKLKTLFHGHSYTGNPISCAAANASLDLMEKQETHDNIERITTREAEFIKSITGHKKVSNPRCIGTIAAFEFGSNNGNNYLAETRDKLYNYFIERKVILRPLGNTIYVLPPYCITNEQLNKVYSVIKGALNEID